jgi:hypothetical protein
VSRVGPSLDLLSPAKILTWRKHPSPQNLRTAPSPDLLRPVHPPPLAQSQKMPCPLIRRQSQIIQTEQHHPRRPLRPLQRRLPRQRKIRHPSFIFGRTSGRHAYFVSISIFSAAIPRFDSITSRAPRYTSQQTSNAISGFTLISPSDLISLTSRTSVPSSLHFPFRQSVLPHQLFLNPFPSPPAPPESPKSRIAPPASAPSAASLAESLWDETSPRPLPQAATPSFHSSGPGSFPASPRKSGSTSSKSSSQALRSGSS